MMSKMEKDQYNRVQILNSQLSAEIARVRVALEREQEKFEAAIRCIRRIATESGNAHALNFERRYLEGDNLGDF